MTVIVLAIPAVPMILIAPAAQPGTMKIAPIPFKEAAKQLDFEASARVEHFHELMQISSEGDEIPKAKSAKRNASSNPSATAPTASPSKESKPAVWAFPQAPAPPEPVIEPIGAPTLRPFFADTFASVGHGDANHASTGFSLTPEASGICYPTSATAELGSPRIGSDTSPVGMNAGDQIAKAFLSDKAKAEALPHDQALPHDMSQTLTQSGVQPAAQALPQRWSKAATASKPTVSSVEIAKSGTAPTVALTPLHEVILSRYAPQAVAQPTQAWPQNLSEASSEGKPTASATRIAKSTPAFDIASTLDDPMPTRSEAGVIPAAVNDLQAAAVTIEASLPPTMPAQDIGMDPTARIFVQPTFGAAPRESTHRDSHASRPAVAATSAHKHSDYSREQPESQARATPAAGPMATISEIMPSVDLPPQSDATPHTEPATHREPAMHGALTTPAAKLLAASIEQTHPAASNTLASVAAPGPSGAPVEFVSNMVPDAPIGDARTAEVSFEARLQSMPQAEVAPKKIDMAPYDPQQHPLAPEQLGQDGPPTSNVTAVAASANKHSDSQRERQEGQANISPPARTAAEPVTHFETDPTPATNVIPAPVASDGRVASAALAQVAAPLPSHATAASAEARSVADRVSAPSASNDIKIALNDNGQRVELRVTERAGDIHVTVRTPDSQLATAMREELPALSSRLEQSGFHSEIWKPAASPSGESRMIEVSGGNAAYDSREQQGGRQNQEDPQQNHRNPQQTLIRKSDRKEFSWLLESIR